MGSCFSSESAGDADQKKRSQMIDRKLEEDSRRLRRECKILLLGMASDRRLGACSAVANIDPGSGESGKSTIVKQMKIIHQNGFSIDELLAFRPTIHKNAVDSAQAVVFVLRACGLEGLLAESHRHLPEAILGAKPEAALSGETADAIEALWRDPVIARVLDEHQSEFYLMDSAA